MRHPTPIDELYAWHSAAIAGKSPTVTSDPQCGWFKVPLVKGATPVPARIWCEQKIEAGELIEPERLVCEVDGIARDPEEQWPWLCKRPIRVTEFEYLTQLRRWQRVNAPDEYAAAREPVDHLSTPVLEE